MVYVKGWDMAVIFSRKASMIQIVSFACKRRFLDVFDMENKMNEKRNS